MSTFKDILYIEMITLKEIAEQGKVSIATVSNILNGKTNVSEETRERVLKIIKETGYKPNYMARGLRAASTKTIGLIVDDISEFSSPTIINGIMARLEANGYKTILENLRFYSKWGHDWEHTDAYKQSIEAAIEEFSIIKTDGIIYVAGHAREITELPSSLQVPLVICYAFTKREGTPCIMIDDKSAAFAMTEHFIENKQFKIGVITGAANNIHTDERLEGYKMALAAHNISFDNRLVKTGNWYSNSGYEGCKALLSDFPDLSAIFCFNDIMAAGVYKYLNETGRKPGKDISVTGFDNRDISTLVMPPLTTMEIPLFSVGETGAQTLLDMIKEKSEDADAKFDNKKIYIPCTLIDRNSVIKNK